MSALPDRLRPFAGETPPVKALRSPRARATLLLPAGVLFFAGIPLYFGLRPDIRWLRPLILGGLSVCQFAIGWALVYTSLRESVPGRAVSTRALIWLVALAWVVLGAVTFATAEVSSLRPSIAAWARVFFICLLYPIVIAAPLMMLLLYAAFRAFPVRPGIVGALSGFAAGITVDAGWRLYCHFGDPVHVFSTHMLGVACLVVLGALTATAWANIFRS